MKTFNTPRNNNKCNVSNPHKQWLPCIRHYNELILNHLLNNLMRYMLFTLFYRWGNQGTENLKCLSKAQSSWNGKMGYKECLQIRNKTNIPLEKWGIFKKTINMKKSLQYFYYYHRMCSGNLLMDLKTLWV